VINNTFFTRPCTVLAAREKDRTTTTTVLARDRVKRRQRKNPRARRAATLNCARTPKWTLCSIRRPAKLLCSKVSSGCRNNMCANTTVKKHNLVTGDYYWKLTDDGLAQGYPKSIAGTWSGLPGNIDAAFTYKNGKTYFFKGTKYWKYTDTTMDDGYPKDIADGFAGIPDNVDAALVWSGNGKIYFFKGWFCVTAFRLLAFVCRYKKKKKNRLIWSWLIACVCFILTNPITLF